MKAMYPLMNKGLYDAKQLASLRKSNSDGRAL